MLEPGINIIGAGLAGLSAAWLLSETGIPSRLISVQASERAQSNLAEGGINAVLDVMGEKDTTEEHFADTMRGGAYLADPNMVRNLVEAAPEIIGMMERLGVPFHRENGKLIERNFGGQKKKRTAYAMSSTGKVLMQALIDAVRKYEAEGLVRRYPHHVFERLAISDGADGPACIGVQIRDVYTQERCVLAGPVIMASGGMNGMFTGATTGTTANTGSASARLFAQGVEFANLEFLQYHPTTFSIPGKRLLVSEAARGEGGRLFFFREDGGKCFFLEEKYGKGGNLMPRDVISREIALLDRPVFLDLTGLSRNVWENRLSDLREEILHYKNIDPAKEPVPVSPGIHYFMGGILVDRDHRTNVKDLYAAGECACAYHGANRLGGNSLLGAIYGGRVAARTAAERYTAGENGQSGMTVPGASGRTAVSQEKGTVLQDKAEVVSCTSLRPEEKDAEEKIQRALLSGLSILRDEKSITEALSMLDQDSGSAAGKSGDERISDELSARRLLARAMLLSALCRRESRGAHTRTDFPEKDEAFRKTTVAAAKEEEIFIFMREIPGERR